MVSRALPDGRTTYPESRTLRTFPQVRTESGPVMARGAKVPWYSATYLSSRPARTRRTPVGSSRHTLPVRPVLTPSASSRSRSCTPVSVRYGPHVGARSRSSAGASASRARSVPSTWPRSSSRSRASIAGTGIAGAGGAVCHPPGVPEGIISYKADRPSHWRRHGRGKPSCLLCPRPSGRSRMRTATSRRYRSSPALTRLSPKALGAIDGVGP